VKQKKPPPTLTKNSLTSLRVRLKKKRRNLSPPKSRKLLRVSRSLQERRVSLQNPLALYKTILMRKTSKIAMRSQRKLLVNRKS
jgi:hypothetical protein